MDRRATWLLTGLTTLLPLALVAQATPMTLGTQAAAAHDFATARHEFETILHRDPGSYEANWRLALVLIDVAKQVPDHIASPARDSTYLLAESYARRAIVANPDGAQGHFALANAVGRGSLSKSARDRVRRALEVRREAMRAIEIDPHHDGAWHILGRWNAEVERLSSLERFFARTFLGAALFNSASWDEANRDMHLAIEYAPNRIVHHYDFAQILFWQKRYADARQQLDIVAALPNDDVSDPMYKTQARDLARQIAEKLQHK